MKQLLIITYLIISLFLFGTFHTSLWVWISFFINWSILSLIFGYHLYIEKTYSPFISTLIVFHFLFFIIAPIIQINSFYGLTKPKFVNHFIYRENLAVYTNVLIVIFTVVFFQFYLLFKKRKINTEKTYSKSQQKNLPLIILVLLFLSIAIVILTYDYTMGLYVKRPSSVVTMLMLKKTLFFIPLGGVFMSYGYLNKKTFKNYNFVYIAISFLIFLFLVFWFKNPMIEKRNALGPIYISLIYLFLPKLLNSNVKFLTFLFFAMVIGFPLISIITHINIPIGELTAEILIEHFKNEDLLKVFKTLHYDAFSSIMVTIELVQERGFSLGFQLLSTVLFFIPRSIWVGKPYSSGQLIGEYLIDNYHFTFANLSNPLVSEGFLNFGIVGVIVFAIVLAYFIVYMLGWLHSKNTIKKMLAFYFAVHLMFLLRGDLTNSVTYFIGVVIGVFLFFKFVNTIINILLMKVNVSKK